MQTVNTKELAVSSKLPDSIPSGTQEIDYAAIVATHARRKIAHGSVVTQSFKLNQANLFSSVCSEVKSRRGLDEKTLPVEIANRISDEIQTFIMAQINSVTPDNITGISKAFKYKAKENTVVEAVMVKGENIISIKERLFALTLLKGKAEKRLKELQAKPTPDLDAELRQKQNLMQYQLTTDHLQAELERQAKVAAT